MYTRCPACSTVHPVNAALLSRHGGQFRCGKCNKASNALDALYDEWPKAGQRPPERSDVPVLGLKIDLDRARMERLGGASGRRGEQLSAPARTSAVGRSLARAAWLVGGVLLGSIIILNTADFAGQPVLENGAVTDTLVKLGLREPELHAPFRDLDRIHLVSRELKTDPLNRGVLRLEAIIVNRADRNQPYPGIEVALLDAEGSMLTTVRFRTEDYLDDTAAIESGFATNAYLPFTLELEDPGEEAVGFELKFH